MSNPPTITGSHIPGYIPNNVSIIDLGGAFTSWYEARSQMTDGVRTNAGGAAPVETYVASGNMPIPIVSDMEGNPSANYTHVTTTTVSVGNRGIVVASYDGSGQGIAEFNRIITAANYLNYIFSALSPAAVLALSKVNGVFYTGDPESRSGIELKSGIFMLTAKDMVGTDTRGGYSTLSVADRIVHDGHHVVQYQAGKYAAVGDATTATKLEAAIALEREAVAVGLQAGAALLNHPAAQADPYYAWTLNQMKKYVDPVNPEYEERQQMLRNRYREKFPTIPNGGGPVSPVQENQ